MSEIYAGLIEELDWKVQVFENAEEALEQIPALPRARLILVDFTLPRTTGTELVKSLDALIPDLRRTTLVVGFSNHATTNPEVREFKSIVDSYFEKPHDLEVFIQTVSSLLSGK